MSYRQQASFVAGVNRWAHISECGTYRYALGRDWSGARNLSRLVFVMLNPSTADDRNDDPTIRRCVGFAKREGYGGIDVVNLFAWRATYPEDLRAAILDGHDAIGPANDQAIELAVTGRDVVLAWGVMLGWTRTRAIVVEHGLLRKHAKRIFVLGRTRDGDPRHPLFVPGDAKLEEVTSS